VNNPPRRLITSRFGGKNAANNVIVTFLKILLVTTTGSGSLDVFPYGKGFWSGQISLKTVRKVRFLPFLGFIVFAKMTGYATFKIGRNDIRKVMQ
jgi:hypothetical protein